MASQYHAFGPVMLPLWALLLAAAVNTTSPMAEMGNAAISEPLRNLCGGTRDPHLSRPRHQFRNDGLEPAAILASSVGLGLHSRLDGDRDRPRPAACRVVLPGSETISVACDERLGRAHARSRAELIYFAFTSGFGFPLGVVGDRERHFRGVLFLPGAQGVGFRWTRASWCRAGLTLLCAYIGFGGRCAPQSSRGGRTFRGRTTLASGEPCGAASAADADALGRIGQHSGRRVAHYVSRTGRCRREARNFTSQRSHPLTSSRRLRSCAMSRFIFGSRDFRSGAVRTAQGNETAIEISDVRFFREVDPIAAKDPPHVKSGSPPARSGRTGFTFEVVFDAQEPRNFTRF